MVTPLVSDVWALLSGRDGVVWQQPGLQRAGPGLHAEQQGSGEGDGGGGGGLGGRPLSHPHVLPQVHH